MGAGLQAVGVVLGVLGWALQCSCTWSQVWRVRSQAEGISSSQRQFEGLWMSCAASSLGAVQCSRYTTLLGLPVHLQACRALMVLSLLLGLSSALISTLGLKCTKIGRTPDRIKDQMALSGGILFILAGLFTLTAVSWFAARVIQEFYDPFYGGVRFELGAGLYQGWVSSGLSLLGGALLCCSCRRTCSSSSSSPPAGKFYYSSGQRPNIYRAAPPSDITSKSYV